MSRSEHHKRSNLKSGLAQVSAAARYRLAQLLNCPRAGLAMYCPVLGFLLMEKPLGLFIYMVLVILTPAARPESEKRPRNGRSNGPLPSPLMLGGLLIFLISDHPFAQSDWFLSGILPVLMAMLCVDWLDRHAQITLQKAGADPTAGNEGQ